jgi:hypothetical protein
MQTKLFAVVVDSVVDGVYLAESLDLMRQLAPWADLVVDVTDYGQSAPSAGWLLDDSGQFVDPEAPEDASVEDTEEPAEEDPVS